MLATRGLGDGVAEVAPLLVVDEFLGVAAMGQLLGTHTVGRVRIGMAASATVGVPVSVQSQSPPPR